MPEDTETTTPSTTDQESNEPKDDDAGAAGPKEQPTRPQGRPTPVDILAGRARMTPEERAALDAKQVEKPAAEKAAPPSPHRFGYDAAGLLKCTVHPGCTARPGH